jgi:AAHS family 4-hydroxybenzoate transporter-like MFS transporter
MLTGVGFATPTASNMLAASNLGGVVGAVFAAFIIQKFGSRLTMLTLSALAIASGVLLTMIPLNPADTSLLFVMILVIGCLLNAVQTTMYALAANVYPTEVRGTGVGIAVGVGRIGHVLSAYVGAWALAGGPTRYFLSISGTMALVFISLALVKRHIESASTVAATQKVQATATAK